MNLFLTTPSSIRKLKSVEMWRPIPSEYLQFYNLEIFSHDTQINKTMRKEMTERIDALKYIDTLCSYILEIFTYIDQFPDLLHCTRSIRFMKNIQSFGNNERFPLILNQYISTLSSIIPGLIDRMDYSEDKMQFFENLSYTIPSQPSISDPRGYFLYYSAKEKSIEVMESITRYFRIEIARHLTSFRLYSYVGWAKWNPLFLVDNETFNAFHFLYEPDDISEKELSESSLPREEKVIRIKNFHQEIKKALSILYESSFIPIKPHQIGIFENNDNKTKLIITNNKVLLRKLESANDDYPGFLDNLPNILSHNTFEINDDFLKSNISDSTLTYFFCYLSWKNVKSHSIKKITKKNEKQKRRKWENVLNLFHLNKNTVYSSSSQFDPYDKKKIDELYLLGLIT